MESEALDHFVFKGIPESLKNVPYKAMYGNQLLVFNNGRIFRIKGNSLIEAKQSDTGFKGKYKCLYLKINGKRKIEYVHRIVATAFLENPRDKEMVNHKDNNGHNNAVENLEWSTGKENMQHAHDIGAYDVDSYDKCFFCNKRTYSKYKVCKKCILIQQKAEKHKQKIDRLEMDFENLNFDSLTQRSKRIVNYHVKGKTDQQIAEFLGLTRQRVNQIISEIKKGI